MENKNIAKEEEYKRNAEKLAKELIKGVGSNPDDPAKKKLPKKPVVEFQFSTELQQALNTKIGEFNNLTTQIQTIDEKISEKERLEREKEEVVIDVSQLTPEFVLLSLHKVAKHPAIIKYIEEVGDLEVFEDNRGFGKNLIFFSKIDQVFYEEKMEALRSHVPLIQNSKRTKADKTRGIEEVYEKVARFQEKLDDLKSAGGIIYLYVESEKKCHRLDYFARAEREQTESLSLLKIYFGENTVCESVFPEFNTPDTIMTQITKNIIKYGDNTLSPLRKKIAELTRKLEDF